MIFQLIRTFKAKFIGAKSVIMTPVLMILCCQIDIISSSIMVLCSEVNNNWEEKTVFPSYVLYCHVQAAVC